VSGNQQTTAIGVGAQAGATGVGQVLATAVGFGALANAGSATAVGARATAIGEQSVAFGNDAGINGAVTNAANTAIGTTAGQQVRGTFNTALGNSAGNVVTGSNNAGIGLDSGFQVRGNANAALGQKAGAIVVGNNNTAIGLNAGNNIGTLAAPVNDTVAIGTNAVASQSGGVAIGLNAVSSAPSAVALGGGSVANQANTVSVGAVGNERRITNVAAGISATDAVNVGQLSNFSNSFQSQFNGLQNQVTDNLREARGGVALALAAGGLRFDNRPGKWSVAGAYGNFKGLSGLAFGLGYAATDRLRFNATISGAPEQGSMGAVVSGSFTLN
jgi:hypothetical protein